MQHLEQYRTTLRRGQTQELWQERELTQLSDKLMRQFEMALNRYCPESTGELVAFIERYGKIFSEIYEEMIDAPKPRWNDHEREIGRISLALSGYYRWLSKLPRLSDDQLEIFEHIDSLMRFRLHEKFGTCLFPEDRVEVDAIANALNIDLYRSHLVLSLDTETVLQDGWYSEDRRDYGEDD